MRRLQQCRSYPKPGAKRRHATTRVRGEARILGKWGAHRAPSTRLFPRLPLRLARAGYSGLEVGMPASPLLLCLFLLCGTAWGQTPVTETPRSAMDRADSLIREGKTAEALAVLEPLAQREPGTPGVERL